MPRRASLGILFLSALFAGLVMPEGGVAHPGIHEQEAAAAAALAESPGDPERHLALGRVHAEKREWDAALALYASARGLGADDARVARLEGSAYLEAGWPHMARTRFDRTLGVNPNDGAAHLGRARAWMKLDHPENASKDFEVALTTLPLIQPGYVLEHHDALLAANRPDDAIAALDAGIVRLGQVPALQVAAIDARVGAGRYDDALRRIDLLLAASPGHPGWSARRAEILEQAGRTEEARLAYVDALAQIQVRTSRRRTGRLNALEKEVRAAIQRNTTSEEPSP